MQLRKGEVIEIEIDAPAFGGRGIGSYEGKRVFVDKCVPGDLVKASLRRIKPKFLEAELVEVVKDSEDRIEAKCKHFGVCGGCQMQFLPYEKQLEYKRQHVKDAFERIGGFKDVDVKEVLGCSEPFLYRNKMEFSFGYDAEMDFALGLHLPKRRYDILDLEECYLESDFAVRILKFTRAFACEKGFEPRSYSLDKGFLKSLMVREGKRTGEVLVNLVTIEEVPEEFEESLDEFLEGLLKLRPAEKEVEKRISTVYWSKIINKRGSPRRVVEKLLFGKEALTERMELFNGDALNFDILPQAFFQPNTFQAEVLYGEVMKLAEKANHDLVFDLFCGTGTIGLFLAGKCERLVGIELNESAVEVARENARKNGVENIDFYAGSVQSLIDNLEEKPSLIVVDPPRAGLSEKLIERISNFESKYVIYVSCNPATMARDCKWFAEKGFGFDFIQPVDMFPHTYHVENIVLLER